MELLVKSARFQVPKNGFPAAQPKNENGPFTKEDGLKSKSKNPFQNSILLRKRGLIFSNFEIWLNLDQSDLISDSKDMWKHWLLIGQL